MYSEFAHFGETFLYSQMRACQKRFHKQGHLNESALPAPVGQRGWTDAVRFGQTNRGADLENRCCSCSVDIQIAADDNVPGVALEHLTHHLFNRASMINDQQVRFGFCGQFGELRCRCVILACKGLKSSWPL